MPHRPGQEDIIVTATRAVATMVGISCIIMIVTQSYALVADTRAAPTDTLLLNNPANKHIQDKANQALSAAANTAKPQSTTTPPTSALQHEIAKRNEKFVGARCYMDIAIDGEAVGRVVIGLYSTLVPRASENFRSLCTGSRGAQYSYKGTTFHRIIPDFIVQGGGLHVESEV
jgi:hypothetical protein